MNSTFSLFWPAAFGPRALTLLLALLLAEVAVFGASLKLEGQSKGCGNWISGNLRNWRDLDYVPCRVRITGKAIKCKTIRITFPDQSCAKPGFENLLHFTVSDNVSIVSGPEFSSTVGGIRSCTLAVSYTGGGEGYVQFFARLASGAHKNPGSSLMLGGEPASMGRLQIHEPAPADNSSAFALSQAIGRCQMLPDGCFQVELGTLSGRMYGIQYSSDLGSWKTAQCLITGNGSWLKWVDRGLPETESHPSTQAMRFYRAFLLPDNAERCDKHSGRDKSCTRHRR